MSYMHLFCFCVSLLLSFLGMAYLLVKASEWLDDMEDEFFDDYD